MGNHEEVILPVDNGLSPVMHFELERDVASLRIVTQVNSLVSMLYYVMIIIKLLRSLEIAYGCGAHNL